MEPRHLRGKGPLLPFDSLWNADKDHLGLIVGFHDNEGTTVYGKMTRCREISPDLIQATIRHKNNSTSSHQLANNAPMRVLTQRKCPWCRTMFFPLHQDQHYCQPDHEAAQDTKCRATRKLLQHTCHKLGVTCLSPEKKTYLSQAAAVTGAKNSRRRYGTRLTPYLCVCERWHLGHPAKTPEWLGCGQIDPTTEHISRFLSAHGIDTSSKAFHAAAEDALEWYWADAPQELLSADPDPNVSAT